MWNLRPCRKTLVVLALAACLAPEIAAAAERGPAPSFWDPGLHLERPDLSGVRAIRFLTDDDYPPLNFALADGSLSGFNVDIARAICEELLIGCTIQARRWDTLIDSLETGKGDAVIASIAMSAAARARIDFTQPYYQTPARLRRARIRFSRTRRRPRFSAEASASSPGRRMNPISRRFFPARRPRPIRASPPCTTRSKAARSTPLSPTACR